jgi:glycosyltransferase involved in cell wall biosynthesis
MNTPAALLSIVILTRDEEKNLPTSLASISGLKAQVFIVDSGSTDGTIAIAEASGCRIYTHPFVNYATQYEWALANLPLATPWVMRLDADERLTEELVAELRTELPRMPDDVSAIEVRRRVYFWGKWIRHGGYYPTWLLRIWRRGLAKCEQRFMDEHMVVASGRIVRMSGDIIDENHKGLGFWTDKHNRYADREVQDLMSIARDNEGSGAMPEGQAGTRRWLKERIYAKSPLFARAFLYWAFRYFIRLGFLDGRAGLVFHFLQGFWYRFLVDAKLHEMRIKGRS